MSVYIVGEAPSRSSDPRDPITGVCGAKLAAFSGLSLDEFRTTFERVNLLKEWPGVADGAKGTAWSAQLSVLAMVRALSLMRNSPSSTFVLLGKRVGRAFGVERNEYFVRQKGFDDFHRHEFVVVPHPSGINRWYNSEENTKRMRRFMRGVARNGRIRMANHAALAAHAKPKKTPQLAAAKPPKAEKPVKAKTERTKPVVAEKRELVRLEGEIGKKLVGASAVARRVIRFEFEDGTFFDVKPTGYPKSKVTAARDAALAWFKAQLGAKP